ncbi:hypothetical protein CONLIGDRAFT_636093 [Coniochaeta ligniaria NRRL 30616]|uniref:Uncharacterized protein n=1 Tax=Coniochaeta ligniaria NRRL 30616 TaxID=1408157 RepID=A0A1J7J738_9PEZI|nr:hypothetical protein CONLIGDRAFT_636093 [Coniochaeta ligniaria NRRL 30616]
MARCYTDDVSCRRVSLASWYTIRCGVPLEQTSGHMGTKHQDRRRSLARISSFRLHPNAQDSAERPGNAPRSTPPLHNGLASTPR